MKVNVSFELDLSAHPGINIETLKQLRGGLQNLSSFFHELHLTNLCHLTDAMAKPVTESFSQEFKTALIESYQWDCDLSDQLFKNYQVQGVTDDGHSFNSVHQEPGYREKMLIDGIETQEF